MSLREIKMNRRQVLGVIAFVALAGGIICYHAYNIIQTKREISRFDPSFVRIMRTTNMYADCGRFESGQNRAVFPSGEPFYRIGAHLYVERQIRAAEQAGDPVRGFPRCEGNRKGGWVALIFDPLLLPIVGTAVRGGLR